MKSCWNAVPEERPTFSSIKNTFEIYYHFKGNTEDHPEDEQLEDLLEKVNHESSKTIDYRKQSIISDVQIQYAQLIHHKENLRKQFDAIDRYNLYIPEFNLFITNIIEFIEEDKFYLYNKHGLLF